MKSFPNSILLSQAQAMAIAVAQGSTPLGARGVTRDGRVFRWTRNGATALKAGYLCQGAVPSALDLLLQTAGTTKMSISSTVLHLWQGSASTALTFSTANAMKEGYIWLRTSSTAKGGGQYVQIKSHLANAESSAVDLKVQVTEDARFYNAGSTNIGSTAMTMGVIRNPFDKVVVKPSGLLTSLAVGVPIRPITANYYFWMQTWGPCAVCVTGILDAGQVVGHSSGSCIGQIDGFTSTGVTSGTSAGQGIKWSALRNAMFSDIGNIMTTGVAGEFHLIFLKLAP